MVEGSWPRPKVLIATAIVAVGVAVLASGNLLQLAWWSAGGEVPGGTLTIQLMDPVEDLTYQRYRSLSTEGSGCQRSQSDMWDLDLRKGQFAFDSMALASGDCTIVFRVRGTRANETYDETATIHARVPEGYQAKAWIAVGPNGLEAPPGTVEPRWANDPAIRPPGVLLPPLLQLLSFLVFAYFMAIEARRPSVVAGAVTLLLSLPWRPALASAPGWLIPSLVGALVAVAVARWVMYSPGPTGEMP